MPGAVPDSDRTRVGEVVGSSRSILGAAKELARRSRRLSWLAWGFLYAAYGGLFVVSVLTVYFAIQITTTVPGGATSTTSVPPLWAFPLAFAPALALLVWAVHELFAGRAATVAALRGTPRPDTLAFVASNDVPGWTQQVVEAQKLLTTAKLETDWTFLPLGLGLLGAVVNSVLALGTISGDGTLYLLVAVAVGFGLGATALYLLYRVAREWIGGFQERLDRQVREVSALEAEFLWRFAGSPA